MVEAEETACFSLDPARASTAGAGLFLVWSKPLVA